MASEGTALSPEIQKSLEQIAGYLNFSEGQDDTRFLAAMRLLPGQETRFNPIASSPQPSKAVSTPVDEAVSLENDARENDTSGQHQNNFTDDGVPAKWVQWLALLRAALDRVSQSDPTYRDVSQARYVLDFTENEFIPAYRQFHQTLLSHHRDDDLFTPFFLARLFQQELQLYAEHRSELTFELVRSRFDNYIGYRPVAVLESQKLEPYPNEWTHPIPIYISGVGAAMGVYQTIVETAIRMIKDAPEEICTAAQLDLDLLDEIAIDPRAYDFEHPVNKRPNYHFGQWDPHKLDLSGYYRRFIVQQVTLDSLTRRCDQEDHQYPEMIFEAGAVLAGTILMAASICGRSPDSFDSNTSIAQLLPNIAQLRDGFYQWLLSTVKGKHGERLREEAQEKRQPFGGARQHLNAELANLRETQLEYLRLSGIYARMGYSTAAHQLTESIQVASARIRTQIECKLTDAMLRMRKNEYVESADELDSVFRLIQKGIHCGGLIDPWNILGFDAQFSLFPSTENSVPDERANYLVDVMNHFFCLYSALWSHAAALDDQVLCSRVRESFEAVANWWHQFAAHEVANVDAANARELFEAASHVAEAMNLWQKENDQAGNVAFWAQHAGLFGTPRAYELILLALFDRRDLKTAMALLMHWLSQADSVGLESADSSFHLLAEQWAYKTCEQALELHRSGKIDQTMECLKSLRRFLDHLEANAEEYWLVPDFELGEKRVGDVPDQPAEEEPDELYGAAYDGVVFRDSTDDGFEGEIFESNDGSADQLELEANRIEDRLRFHDTISRVWELVAPVFAESLNGFADDEKNAVADCISQWAKYAESNVGQMHQLLYSIESLKPTTQMGDHDSMVEYDRQRFIQESLMERVIGVTVNTRHAMRMLNASNTAIFGGPSNPELDAGEVLIADVFAAAFQGDRQKLADQLRMLFDELRKLPLLYVPISRDGPPSKIELVKSRQLFIRKLLEILPRLGLIEQVFRLLNVARSMERSHPVGNGAVTEFDDLFEIGFRAVVDCLILAANHDDSTADQRQLLFRWLERYTESSLIIWLKHSRTLRLSILEKVHDKGPWRNLVVFIKRYGRDIFTQRFLNFSNVRGILHNGVEEWLNVLLESEDNTFELRLLEDLREEKISVEEASGHLSLILEAMLENHLEYQDYNSTTTQSDQGDMLYMLIDFLRLKVGYERICWHLRPVFWAHENLVYAGKEQVSKRWRRSLIDRIDKKATRFVRLLERLQRRYAMRMPSVSNRIQEKFIKPMQIDRMKALVAPAMDPTNSQASSSFEMLHHDASQLLQKPEGSGIKVPAWLAAVEDEVARVLDRSVTDQKILDLMITPKPLPREEVREQLNNISAMTNKKRPRGSDG